MWVGFDLGKFEEEEEECTGRWRWWITILSGSELMVEFELTILPTSNFFLQLFTRDILRRSWSFLRPRNTPARGTRTAPTSRNTSSNSQLDLRRILTPRWWLSVRLILKVGKCVMLFLELQERTKRGSDSYSFSGLRKMYLSIPWQFQLYLIPESH